MLQRTIRNDIFFLFCILIISRQSNQRLRTAVLACVKWISFRFRFLKKQNLTHFLNIYMGTFLVPPRRQPALPILYWNKVFIWYVPMYTIVHGVQTRTFWIEIHVFYHDFIKKITGLRCFSLRVPRLLKDQNLHIKLQFSIDSLKLQNFTIFEPSLPIQSYRGFCEWKRHPICASHY